MADRSSSTKRLSQGFSPYDKNIRGSSTPHRPSSRGLWGAVTGLVTGSLFPSAQKQRIIDGDLNAAADTDETQPNRLPYAVHGDTALFFDCRAQTLQSEFGYAHGDALIHGEASPFAGSTSIVVGTRCGKLWVVSEEPNALAVPLEGSNHEELQAYYQFQNSGRRVVKPCEEHVSVLRLTDAQRTFVQTTEDIKAVISGGLIAPGQTWPVVFSPVPLQNGAVGYGTCVSTTAGLYSLQLSSAFVVLPDDGGTAVTQSD